MKTEKDKLSKYRSCVHFIIQAIDHDKYWKYEKFVLESKEEFIKYLKARKVHSTIGTNFKSKEFKLAIDHVFELLRSKIC